MHQVGSGVPGANDVGPRGVAVGRAIDAVIGPAVEQRRLVGAVVMIALDGEVICQRAAGFADGEAGRPVAIDTIFRLASLTKPIVTAAALSLIETGELSFDDAVSAWLPDFRPRLGDGREPQITVRHLLTHTSGLSYGFLEPADGPYHQAGVSDGLDQPGVSFEDNLARLAKVPLFFEPGSRWCYSVGMDVLGALLERAARQPLPGIVRERVTAPLQMRDTAFTVRDRARLARAYADGPQGAVPMGERHVQPFAGLAGISYVPDRMFDAASFPSAGAGMAGTAPDMLRLLEVVRGGGGPILSAPTAAAMMHNQIGELPVDISGPGWGFGFGGAVLLDPALANTPQSEGTWRWGGVYGHTWFVDPARGLTVVAMSNTAVEGMAGQYTIDLRDAIYRGLQAV